MINWYLQNGKESDVVISTRVRLLRNLEGINFVNKNLNNEKILKIMEEILPIIGYGLKMYKLKDMDELTKKSLVEKNIISINCMKPENKNIAILINNEENICIIINEEDHIKLQVFSEGLEIENLTNLAIEIDKKIEQQVKYAYNEKYGYLTACPINIGTGMEVSTIVHLPGLCKTENLAKILKIINNLGMNVKSLYKENIENKNCIYQINNNQTLGITEGELAQNMKLMIQKVIEQERLARKYLGKTEIQLENSLYRAFGILAYSKILTQEDCEELLSEVKLGTDMGIISELDDLKVKKLLLYTKSANLQKFFGQSMNTREQSIKRAELVKQIINEK